MKGIKITAIVASAILLIFIAAFSAMAANSWTIINGQWCAVDNEGNPVEYVWVIGQDGIKYWAGEDGLWVTGAWVGEDEDIYVGADGKVATGWQYIANSEEEVEDYGNASWFYLTSKGKKTFCTTKAKLIDGARYCFDSTGRMLSGWVGPDGSETGFVTIDPDEGISAAEYYCNSDGEGWAATGWKYLYAPDGENTDTDYFWFFFNKTSGAITKNGDDYKKKIDGLNYTFDADGRMLTGFVPAEASASSVSYALTSGNVVQKGWIWGIPTAKMIECDPEGLDDQTSHWFWAQSNGNLLTNSFTHGNGTSSTWYALDKNGVMLSGLYEISVINPGVSKISDAVSNIPYYGKAIDDADKITNFGSLYVYFGDETTDGSLKTGEQNVNINGEKVSMRFSKSIKDIYYITTSDGEHAQEKHITPGLSVYGFNGGKYYGNGQPLCGDEDNGLTIVNYKATHLYDDPEKAIGVIPETRVEGGKLVLDDVSFAEAKQNATLVGDYYELEDGTKYCIVKPDGTFVKKASGIKDAAGNKYYVSDYRLTKIKEAK